jgi:hypothetical protein
MKEGVAIEREFSKIHWSRPTWDDIRHEAGEIERTVQYFFDIDPKSETGRQCVWNMAKSLLDGKYQLLDDAIWEILENTDSWENVHEGEIEEAVRLAQENQRDIHKFFKVFQEGKQIPAPTIIKYKDRYHKVGGNTRLMAARVLGERPYVLIGEYKEYERI